METPQGQAEVLRKSGSRYKTKQFYDILVKILFVGILIDRNTFWSLQSFLATWGNTANTEYVKHLHSWMYFFIHSFFLASANP